VSNRIGLAASDDPEKVERQLCAVLPPDRWTAASDTLILHGRRVCKPRPVCDRCGVRAHCDYYRGGAAVKSPAPGASRRAGGREPAPAAGRRRGGGAGRS
jgi:endonuclease-3